MASFTLDCRCGERYHVDDSQAGRQLVCRRCGNRLEVGPRPEAKPGGPGTARKARIRRSFRRH